MRSGRDLGTAGTCRCRKPVPPCPQKWTHPNRTGRDGRQSAPRSPHTSSGSPPRTTAGGYQRIQGELLKVSHWVSASTILRVLKALKIPPAPQRRTDATWRDFLRAQAAATLAVLAAFEVPHLGPCHSGRWIRRRCR
jgi:hypothetical protein